MSATGKSSKVFQEMISGKLDANDTTDNTVMDAFEIESDSNLIFNNYELLKDRLSLAIQESEILLKTKFEDEIERLSKENAQLIQENIQIKKENMQTNMKMEDLEFKQSLTFVTPVLSPDQQKDEPPNKVSNININEINKYSVSLPSPVPISVPNITSIISAPVLATTPTSNRSHKKSFPALKNTPLPANPIPKSSNNISAAPLPTTAPLSTAAPVPTFAPLPTSNNVSAAPVSFGLPPPFPMSSAFIPTVIPPPSIMCSIVPVIEMKAKDVIPAPRKKLKNFHWKPVRRIKEEDHSIWNDISLINMNIVFTADDVNKSVIVNEENKHDDEKIDITLNIDIFEQLFAKKTRNKKKKQKQSSSNNVTNNHSKNKKKKRKKRELIHLFDDKRSYNMCIALNRLRIKNKIIHDAILAVDEQYLNMDKIEKLMFIAPTAEEQETVANFDGDIEDLGVPERFVYAVHNIERLPERLEFWMFKMQFKELCNTAQERVKILSDAYHVIMDNTSFKNMIQYILLIGNYMNSGTKKGNVAGFKLESLLQLKSNKSHDKKENLLSFIVQQLYEKSMKQKKEINSLQFVKDFETGLPSVIRC